MNNAPDLPTQPSPSTPLVDLEPLIPGIQQYHGKTIEQIVPFSDFVLQSPPDELQHEHLTAGLAADFTTHIDNPFFKLPTGQDERYGAVPAAFTMYAPYYIGTGFTPELIATDVAERAAAYLKYLDAEHGYDGYVGRMLSVLRTGHVTKRGLQGIEDQNILYDVNDFMASITNRLRHIAPVTIVAGKPYSAAEVYRTDTHREVDPYVGTVVYGASGDRLSQRFVLPQFIRSDPAQVIALGWDFFKSFTLRRAAEFATLAAEKVANPIVRATLDANYIPPDVRRKLYSLRAH
jgi:hypothetical protein